MYGSRNDGSFLTRSLSKVSAGNKYNKQRMLHERSSFSTAEPVSNVVETKKRRTTNDIPTKTVTFKETVAVRWTINRDNLTPKERHATWYQPEEFEDIKRRIVMLAQKVQRDGAQLTKDKRYCIRGLESLLADRAQKRMQVRHDVWNAVLLEQEKQYLRQSLDEEILAAYSQNISYECQLLAIAVGRRDQKEAEKILSTII
jgi:hypothetical protein